MAEIFVSYKSEDRVKARLVAEALAQEGFDVWWDPALQAGEDYQETIDRNLREALVVVVLWSARSAKSRWVRSEATVGDNFGALAPVKIEPCDLPTAFVLVQTADLSHWSGDREDAAWREFVGDIAAKREKRRATVGENPRASAPDAGAIEALFWQSIKDSNEVADFRSYQRRYPHGHFHDIAANRIAALEAPAPKRRDAPRQSGGFPAWLLGGAVVAAVLAAAFVWRPWTLSSAAPPAAIQSAQASSCDEARRDWEAIRDTTSADVIGALIRETPAGCSVIRAQAQARLNEINGQRPPAPTRRPAATQAASLPPPRPLGPQPRTQALVVNAVAFTGLDHTALGQCVNAPDVLANALPCTAVPENAAEIRFDEPVGQRYRLDVRYAALESRPISIYVNGALALRNALGQTTGGWEIYNQQWVAAGEITTRTGANVLRLYRDGVFPHISAVRLVPLG
jgi:hypothetical protein